MNITLVREMCAKCSRSFAYLSDQPVKTHCPNCNVKRVEKMPVSLTGDAFTARKAELEAQYGTIFGKRRWEKLDPDCYVPLYY